MSNERNRDLPEEDEVTQLTANNGIQEIMKDFGNEYNTLDGELDKLSRVLDTMESKSTNLTLLMDQLLASTKATANEIQQEASKHQQDAASGEIKADDKEDGVAMETDDAFRTRDETPSTQI